MKASDLQNNGECVISLHYPQGQGRSVSKNKLRVINLDIKLLGRKNHKPMLPKDTNTCFLSTSSNFLHHFNQLLKFPIPWKKNGRNLKFKEFIYLNLYCWLPLHVDLLPHYLWYLSVATIFCSRDYEEDHLWGAWETCVHFWPIITWCRMAKQPPRNPEGEFNLM